jgi:hypothetical protein
MAPGDVLDDSVGIRQIMVRLNFHCRERRWLAELLGESLFRRIGGRVAFAHPNDIDLVEQTGFGRKREELEGERAAVFDVGVRFEGLTAHRLILLLA